MSYEQVTVADGKYTVQIGVGTHAGHLNALRHGEPWQDLTGNNLVYWLAVELRNARDELQQRAAEVEQLKNQNRDVARMIVDNDRDGAVQWAKGLTASLADEIEVRVQAPAEGDAADLADFLANTLGFVGDVDDAAAEIVAFLASKVQPKGAQPHGWVVWWPKPGGGYEPIYKHGPKKQSYGRELDELLRHYPVYDVPHAVAQAPAPVDEPAVPCTWKKPGESDDAWLDRITGATQAPAVGADPAVKRAASYFKLWTRHGQGDDEWWSLGKLQARKEGDDWVVRRMVAEVARHEYLQVAMAEADDDFEPPVQPMGGSDV